MNIVICIKIYLDYNHTCTILLTYDNNHTNNIFIYCMYDFNHYICIVRNEVITIKRYTIMKATDLFNYRKEDFETIESFSKRVYETAKRYRSSLHFTPQESYHVLTILAKYYNESASDILSAIRDIEFRCASRKYRIQWVKCLSEHYLVIDKR